MPDAKRYPVVIVEWTDASYQGGVMEPDEFSPLVELRTVGFLAAESETSVTLVIEVNEKDGSVRHATHIPRVCIKRIHRVRR